MKKYAIADIRNVALVSHGGAGKTTLAEAMLYDAGATERLGRTTEGNTVMDHDPEEIRRQVSINAAVAPLEWQGVKVNLVDTPGYFDFVAEVKSSLRVVDSVVVVVDAVGGVEVGTDLVWQYANENDLPRLIFINKMDRENASFERVLESLRSAFGRNVVPVTLPIGQEASFRGVIDLVGTRVVTYEDGKGRDPKIEPLSGVYADQAAKAREVLVEAAAETDDELTMKYLEGEELTAEELRRGLRAGVLSGKLVPVLCGSGLKNTGIQPLLDLIRLVAPSPQDRPPAVGTNPKTGAEEKRPADESGPFSAFVFKTMADPYVGKLTLFRVMSGSLGSNSQVYNAVRNQTERIGQLFLIRGKQQEPVDRVGAGDLAAVAKLQETSTGDTLCDEASPIVFPPTEYPKPVYQVAVQPKAKGDEDKISTALARIREEDPTLTVHKEPGTGETILSGMGELHLAVATERMKRKFGVDVILKTPKVPYKETIRRTAKAEGKFKRQTGGRGQYGHVWIEYSPEPEADFIFTENIFGGVVPKQYIPAVEKGLREAKEEGVLAGFPVTNFKATLYDGSYHEVDSSEMAFKIAASLSFKKGIMEADPVLLEPIMTVSVLIPEAYMGDIIGDLNRRRGRILGMEPSGSMQKVRAMVPLAEMFTYAIDLRSMTQGRGSFSMEFDHYEEVPGHIAQTIIEKHQAEKKEEEA
ncbi:MAG: elongation factor G [Firmicutes bacterium]|nr:elongation factor G [Bacillota bacterium]